MNPELAAGSHQNKKKEEDQGGQQEDQEQFLSLLIGYFFEWCHAGVQELC